MNFLSKINQKLSLGFKITNSNCSTCKGITMVQTQSSNQAHSEQLQLYCPKCQKFQPIRKQECQQNEDQYFQQVVKESNNSAPISLSNNCQEQIIAQKISQNSLRTNNISKKLGQLLIHGWTMLNQSCDTCNVPLMKSKKGQKICTSCNRDYAIKTSQKPIAMKEVSIESQENERIDKCGNIHKQESKIKSSKSTNEASRCKISNKIEQISAKVLDYIDLKLDEVMQKDDLEKMQNYLALVAAIKQLKLIQLKFKGR